MFGGAVPDAMTALIRVLGKLHTADGSVAVPGLLSRLADVPAYGEEQLRAESGLLDGVSPIGHGDFLDRIWNQPSVTVIGIDAPSTAESSNTLLPTASAMVSLRVAPGQDAAEAESILRAFIEAEPPFGARVTTVSVGNGSAFEMESTHEVVGQIKQAMAAAWAVDPVEIGVGGSIPFIADFVREFPEAVVLVTGIEDPDTRAHSPNESLHVPSFEKAIVTEALFLLGSESGSS
jgi:acetylornithine deacetylase/succinyl-diaminopimelate desuccinylase-like protein